MSLMPNATVVPGMVEELCQPFWDSFLYPAAGQAAVPVVLFQKPRGAGITAFGAGAGVGVNTLRDTNMSVPGQLPGGFTLLVSAICVVIGNETIQATAIADASIIAVGGVVQFTVGQKVQHVQPMIKLPGGSGLTGFAAAGAGGALQAVNHGTPDPRAVYSIAVKPVVISPSINFDVTLSWPSGGKAVTAATAVSVFLEGILQRPVQ